MAGFEHESRLPGSWPANHVTFPAIWSHDPSDSRLRCKPLRRPASQTTSRKDALSLASCPKDAGPFCCISLLIKLVVRSALSADIFVLGFQSLLSACLSLTRRYIGLRPRSSSPPASSDSFAPDAGFDRSTIDFPLSHPFHSSFRILSGYYR